MKGITVYTTDLCGFCTRAKAFLCEHGIEYQEINLTKDAAGRVELARRTGMMTFPQVLIDDKLVGGFHELVAAERDGRLDDLHAA
jgi:glutaredoxin 3